jgi:hypothetical protein
MQAAALLLVLTILLIVLCCCRGHRKRREGYLIYPYLDLDEPGERGQHYAMSECP